MIEKKFFPISPVDEFAYLAEVSTPYSFTFATEITLEGEVDIAIVYAALDATLNYYPKFKCILVKDYPSLNHWFRYCWKYQDISSKDILEEVEDINPKGTTKDTVFYLRHYYPSHTIDITRETPLKVMLIRNHRCTHLLFFIHHVIADGISFILFMQQFIQCYEDIFYQRKKKAQLIPDVEAISQPDIRFRWRHFSPKIIGPFLKHIALTKKEPPVPLYPREEGNGEKKLIALVKELPPRQFNSIRSNAKKHQTTINTYLLATMFQTIAQWNQQWNPSAGRIYLSIPINLRSPEDRRVGNFISQFYLTRRYEEVMGNKDTLLRAIQQEQALLLENAKRHVNLTWFLKPIPLHLKTLMFKRPNPSDGSTLILSNIGKCYLNPHHTDEEGYHCMGPARIRNLHGIATPVPWPQLDIITYHERMSMCFSVLRSSFSLKDAENFMDLFIENATAEQGNHT